MCFVKYFDNYFMPPPFFFYNIDRVGIPPPLKIYECLREITQNMYVLKGGCSITKYPAFAVAGTNRVGGLPQIVFFLTNKLF